MSHLFSLKNISPQNIYNLGSRLDVTVNKFPVLNGMALSLLELKAGGVREPHWHPNAHELGYCLEGYGVMTIFGPRFQHATFTIKPGCLTFVPKGYTHYIENQGDSPLRMMICFNHHEPSDINLSSAISSMTPHVLGETFSAQPSFFEAFKDTQNPVFIFEKHNRLASQLDWEVNRFKFDLEEIIPQIQTKGGWVKMSNQKLFPSLEGLGAFSLLLEKNGIREPHWHPNAHELNYLIEGNARITLLSPDGSVETFDMQAGDASFLPQGYFHHIENSGDCAARFIVFFNHENPDDIGLTGCLGAFPNSVLAALFKVPLSYFESFPKYQKDLFVVGGG